MPPRSSFGLPPVFRALHTTLILILGAMAPAVLLAQTSRAADLGASVEPTLPSPGRAAASAPPVATNAPYAKDPVENLRAILRERDLTIQALRLQSGSATTSRADDKPTARAKDNTPVRQAAGPLPPNALQAVPGPTSDPGSAGGPRSPGPRSVGDSGPAQPAPEQRYANYPLEQLIAMLLERDRTIQDLRARLRTAPSWPAETSDRNDDKLAVRALDRSLIRQGASLLPTGARQAVLSLTQASATSWQRGDRTLALALQLGLPRDFQVDAIAVPYRALRERGESQLPRLGISHDFTPEKRSEDLGVVGAVSWQRSTLRIDAVDTQVDTAELSVSVSQRMAPLVFLAVGSLTEQRSKANGADGGLSFRGWGLSGAISINLSPDVAVNVGLDVSRSQAQSWSLGSVTSNAPTAATLRFGLDTSMNTSLPLSLFVGLRVLGEQPNLSVGLSLPYRF